MEHLQETIDYINLKLSPYSLSEQGKETIANLLPKYSSQLICECVDISHEKYAHYDSNGTLTKDSVEEIFDKMIGIIRNRSLGPIEAEIAHVHGYGRKKFGDQWNARQAQDILERYVNALKRINWDEEEIAEDIKTEVIGILRKKETWYQWRGQMRGWCEDIESPSDDG